MTRNLWLLFGLLLTLSAGLPRATDASPAECGLHALDGCRNTNQLIWDPAFAPAVRALLGDREASYPYKQDRVSTQALTVLGGPPDLPQRLGEWYRFTACRLHSCDEKGAVVLTGDGRIMAVAILHSLCAQPVRPDRCSAHTRLALYLHPRADAALITADLSRWAREALEARYTSSTPAVLDGVDVTTVDAD